MQEPLFFRYDCRASAGHCGLYADPWLLLDFVSWAVVPQPKPEKLAVNDYVPQRRCRFDQGVVLVGALVVTTVLTGYSIADIHRGGNAMDKLYRSLRQPPTVTGPTAGSEASIGRALSLIKFTVWKTSMVLLWLLQVPLISRFTPKTVVKHRSTGIW